MQKLETVSFDSRVVVNLTRPCCTSGSVCARVCGDSRRQSRGDAELRARLGGFVDLSHLSF